MNVRIEAVIVVLLTLTGWTSVAFAHGDAAKKGAPVKKEQKPWGIAADTKAAKRVIEVKMIDNMRFAPDNVEIKQGDVVRFLIKNDGTIQIHGAKVEMIGSQESKIGSSSQSVTCNPQKTEIAGAAISSSAVGVHEISGALIKLN